MVECEFDVCVLWIDCDVCVIVVDLYEYGSCIGWFVVGDVGYVDFVKLLCGGYFYGGYCGCVFLCGGVN